MIDADNKYLGKNKLWVVVIQGDNAEIQLAIFNNIQAATECYKYYEYYNMTVGMTECYAQDMFKR